MSASRLIYRLLLLILGLPLLLLFIWQGWKNGVRDYWQERLGFLTNGSKGESSPVWFHAASVGEVNALLPLLKAFTAAHPDQSVLLTTTTISGYQNAQRAVPEIAHHFLPFDFQHSVQRFIRQLAPKALFVVETELWPNLFRACHQQGIPIEIINGRLSQKTLRSPDWVRHLYREALSQVTHIAARSESDRQAFITLGAIPDRVQTLGNIKYAASIIDEQPTPISEFESIKRPIVVAASTRDGEEQIIAASWKASKNENPLLVIVPRHPERLLEILKDLASYHVTIRSRDEAITDTTEIYLADTFGELRSFMAHSDLVIMGGSFVAQGGQNLIEPAASGKAIIVGPHMENFADETQELLAQQAIVQAADGEQLSQILSELLKEPEQRREMGERAQQFVKSHSDVIERYMAFVENTISTVD